MNTVADAWSRQETAAAVACFTPDAMYYKPPEEKTWRRHIGNYP